MTIETTKIPRRQKCVDKNHPYIGGTDDIIDDKSELTVGELVGNKDYDAASHSGMGRVILKKNIVNSVNTLTRDMFYKGEVGSREPNTNTVFVIQYDYTLAEDITIPANCVLQFDGGSISGEHTITGDNTNIVADDVKIFGTDVDIIGNFANKELNLAWFGAIGDTVTDCTSAVQKTVDVIGNINIETITAPDGIYRLTQAINLSPTTESARWTIAFKGKSRPYANVRRGLVFLGNTGSVMFEAIGNLNVTFENIGFFIDKDLCTTPSTMAIFGARGNMQNFYDPRLFLTSCSIYFRVNDHNVVNNGVGYIGVMLKDCEESVFYNCSITADLPVALTPDAKIKLVALDSDGYPTNSSVNFTYVPVFQDDYNHLYIAASNTLQRFYNCAFYIYGNNPCVYIRGSIGVTIKSCYCGSPAGGKKGHAIELANVNAINLDMEIDHYHSSILAINIVRFSNIRTYGGRPSGANKADILLWKEEDSEYFVFANNTIMSYYIALPIANVAASNAYISNNTIWTTGITSTTDDKSHTIDSANLLYTGHNRYNFRDTSAVRPREISLSAGTTIPTSTTTPSGSIRYMMNVNRPIFYLGYGYGSKWLDYLGFNAKDLNDAPLKNVGTTEEREAFNLGTGGAGALFNGFPFYDKDLKKPLWYNGDKYIDANGDSVGIIKAGKYSERPDNPRIGFEFFCTDGYTEDGGSSNQGIPIFHKGNDVWGDALGVLMDYDRIVFDDYILVKEKISNNSLALRFKATSEIELVNGTFVSTGLKKMTCTANNLYILNSSLVSLDSSSDSYLEVKIPRNNVDWITNMVGLVECRDFMSESDFVFGAWDSTNRPYKTTIRHFEELYPKLTGISFNNVWFTKTFDVTPLGENKKLTRVNFINCSAQLTGTFDNLGYCSLTEFVSANTKNVSLDIVRFVEKARTVAGRESGSINIQYAGGMTIKADGTTLTIPTEQNNVLAWTASTITFRGVSY